MFQNPIPLQRLCAALILCLFGAGPAWAQAQPQDNSAFGTMQPIVVSPTGFPVPADETGNSVSVITSDDIDRKQERTLPEALKDVPGLDVVQTGGPGGQTSVFIRGTNSNHTKVLVDGIDVSDPSTPNGAFDFSQIPTWDIERIEVLRGPQSGLYGSDAIGGVVNIVTKQGSGPMLVNAMAEGGSFATFNQAAGVSGSQGRANYDFNVVHLRTADSAVTPPELLAPGEARNDDFASNKVFSGKAGADLTDNFSVSAVGRYINSMTRFTNDDFSQGAYPNGVPESTQTSQEEHEFFSREEAKLLSLDGALENSVGVAYTHYNRSNVDPITTSNTNTYSGERTKLDWKGIGHLGGDRTVMLGLEDESDSFAQNSVSASERNRAGFAELHTPVIERLYATASLRVDDNSTFGRAFTWRLAPSYLVAATDTQLKASYGTGFKAPTLYQLYGSTSANPMLQPETSRGFDLGFEQPLFGKTLSFGSTYFHDNLHNLIDSGPFPNYQYFNLDSATTYGAENFVSYDPVKSVQLRLDYTYTMATTIAPVSGDVPSSTLLRRPKNKTSFEAIWTPIDPLSLTATALWESSWFDYTRDNVSSIYNASAPGYVLINLAASYKVNGNMTLFGRIDNLLNRTYQEPLGFLQPGFGVFAGVKVSWGGE
jgi:vitamin B12 transporter